MNEVKAPRDAASVPSSLMSWWSSPLYLTDVPSNLPYNTRSPSPTGFGITTPVSGWLLPSPVATTMPADGFSFAWSGRKTPPLVASMPSSIFTKM